MHYKLKINKLLQADNKWQSLNKSSMLTKKEIIIL
jgi:hypothetical protein